MTQQSWPIHPDTLAIILGSGGIGAVLSAVISKFRWAEDRRAVNAAAARDEASGEAAVIAATASAFTEVTATLRIEIERMQGELTTMYARVEAAEALAREMTAERDRERAEKLAALAKVDLLTGEVRQLQQVIASTSRAGEA